MRRVMAMAMAGALIGAAAWGVRDVNAGGGCHSETLSDESGTQVEMSKNCFGPTVIRVQGGDLVTWTSNDPERHTVTGVANSWGTYDELGKGDSVSYQFDRSGVFPYFCVLHPSMVGAVVVGDGSAASSASAGGGVKAVSADAPGRADSAGDNRLDESNGDGTSPWLIGGLALAVVGLGGVLFASRKYARRGPS